MWDYEEDHLIPLELGGAPADPRNLWPEKRRSVGRWTARKKDRLERVLNRMVCDGELPLGDAQAAIAEDWTGAYERFIDGAR